MLSTVDKMMPQIMANKTGGGESSLALRNFGSKNGDLNCLYYFYNDFNATTENIKQNMLYLVQIQTRF